MAEENNEVIEEVVEEGGKQKKKPNIARRVAIGAVAAGAIGGGIWYALDHYGGAIKMVAAGTVVGDVLGMDEVGGTLKNMDSAESEAARGDSKVCVEMIQGEGTVLLKNEDNILPLTTDKVNLFGRCSYDSNYTGGGSSGCNRDDDVTLPAALKDRGMEYNETLYNLYMNWVNDEIISTDTPQEKEAETVSNEWVIIFGGAAKDELPVDTFTDDGMDEAKDYSDIAIITVGRSGTEGSDNAVSTFYLDEAEQYMVDEVCDNFDNVIVLLNCGAYMDCSWITEKPQIKAVLYVGFPGNTGWNAVVDILKGDINPSGRTADTWAADIEDCPAMVMLRDDRWNTADMGAVKKAYADYSGDTFRFSNIAEQNVFFDNYYENIYVGYRYYETRYGEDEDEFNKKVVWPFGFGLSYTEFEWEKAADMDYDEAADTLTLHVKVTNTGKVAGKDVVEVYVNPPYYEDRGIEKSTAKLVGFAKTPTLEPDKDDGNGPEYAICDITIPIRELASYDYLNEKTYVLDEGDYILRVSRSSHDVAYEETWTLDEKRLMDTSPITGNKITNCMDDVTFAGDFTYLSRSDWEGTFPKISDVKFEATDKQLDGFCATIDSWHPEETETETQTWGKGAGLKIGDMVEVDFDDPQWDEFVNQLTLDEAESLVASGTYQTIAIESLDVPFASAADGPVGITTLYTGDSGLDYNCATLLTSCWNIDLYQAMGETIGREGTTYGVTYWYGPGMDCHRTVLGGRNYEYYSEDGFLAGKAAANVCIGAYNEGMICVIKHYAVNDQDNNREIFCKPFQMAVEEAQAAGATVACMSMMNRLGNKWASAHPGLIDTLMHDEWGMQGYIITDATGMDNWPFANFTAAVMAGNDMMLANGGGSDQQRMHDKGMEAPKTYEKAIHNACKRILFTVSRSSAVKLGVDAHSKTEGGGMGPGGN